MKKFIAIFFAVIITAAALAGCNPSTNDTSSQGTSSVGDNASSQDTSSVEAPADPQTKLNAILADVKAAYGENYLPDVALDENMLADLYLLDKANVEAFVAEHPMISAQIDRFIGIKAVDGKGEAVAETIRTFHENSKEQLAWYPQNEAKTQAAKIIVHGDYVFYVILGAFPEDEDLEPAVALEFAEKEVKKAVDIINAAF